MPSDRPVSVAMSPVPFPSSVAVVAQPNAEEYFASNPLFSQEYRRTTAVAQGLNLRDRKVMMKRKVARSLDRKAKMDRILSNPVLYERFLQLAKETLADESVEFWRAVTDWEKDPAPVESPAKQAAALAIMDRFVRPGSPREVNISDSQRQDLLAVKTFKKDTFQISKVEIVRLLAVNLLIQFLKKNKGGELDDLLQRVEEPDYDEVEEEVRAFDPDPAINQVMGSAAVSRSEAVRALAKYDNDPVKATAHLVKEALKDQ